MDDISELYTEYRQHCQLGHTTKLLTPKQQELLHRIFPHGDPDDADELWKLYSSILKRQVTSYHEMYHKDCSTLLRYYRNHIPLTSDQMIFLEEGILTRYTWQEISGYVGRPVDQVDQLSQRDFTRIMNHHPEWNLKKSLRKFQFRPKDHVLESNPDWNYGWQQSDIAVDGKLYYLAFYNWMILDYDEMELGEVKKLLAPYLAKYRFYVYRTTRGYHVHLMSHTMDHFCISTMEWMQRVKCDVWYIMFTYKNGFRVRLSHKIHEDVDQPIYTLVVEWGQAELDPDCVRYHDKFVKMIEW